MTMRAGMRQGPTIKSQRPWRLLAISLVLSLLFGFANMGEPLEDILRIARNKANPVAASGDIVVITIDDASQRELGAWPWKRAIHGDIIDGLTAAGARKIALDVAFEYATNDAADRSFADSLKRSGRVVLPVNLRVGEGEGKSRNGRPDAAFSRNAQLGLISLPYNWQGVAWRLPYGLTHNGQAYPSFASVLSGVSGPADTLFPINYRINLDTIPQ
jgi:CHASE2 domain-containing sensor protein